MYAQTCNTANNLSLEILIFSLALSNSDRVSLIYVCSTETCSKSHTLNSLKLHHCYEFRVCVLQTLHILLRQALRGPGEFKESEAAGSDLASPRFSSVLRFYLIL